MALGRGSGGCPLLTREQQRIRAEVRAGSDDLGGRVGSLLITSLSEISETQMKVRRVKDDRGLKSLKKSLRKQKSDTTMEMSQDCRKPERVHLLFVIIGFKMRPVCSAVCFYTSLNQTVQMWSEQTYMGLTRV